MGIEARISSKGQTTIPAEVREKLGLHTGDRIAFIEVEQGYLIIPRNRPVEVLFGALAEYAIPGTTIDDYDRAVGEGVSDHVESSKEAKGKGRR
jgi:antitoxin PrlF